MQTNGQLQVSAAFSSTTEKEPGKAPELEWTFWKRERGHLLRLQEIEPRIIERSSRSLVAISTTLFRLPLITTSPFCQWVTTEVNDCK